MCSISLVGFWFISFFPSCDELRPPSKPSLSCKAIGHDGVGEGSPCKVDEAVAATREVKMVFLCFYKIFSPVHIQAA